MARRSDIERVSAAWRARVLALEASYTRAVGPARRAAALRIRDELGRFLAAIAAEGVPEHVTRRWVTDHAAYQRLVAVAQAELDGVAAEAVRAIRWAVGESAQLGKPAADALTAATIGVPEQQLAAAGGFGQVNVGAMTELVGQLQAASPLQKLAGLNAEALQTMQRELVRGLANGEHSRTIGRRIARAADMPTSRAATIARTEIFRAYRESNRQAYIDSPAVGQWRWVCNPTRRTCSACWAMHNSLHPLSDPLGSHPNCRCTQAPVPDAVFLRSIGIEPPSFEWETGEDLFARQPEATQRSVLGPGKYEAYRAGRIKLADTVHVRTTRKWGTTRSTASLADSLAS